MKSFLIVGITLIALSSALTVYVFKNNLIERSSCTLHEFVQNFIQKMIEPSAQELKEINDLLDTDYKTS